MTPHPSRSQLPRYWSLAVLWASLLLGGCASSPSAHFYVLTPVAQSTHTAGPALILGVGPVRLPAYLDQPQMVRWVTANRVEIEELERWGAPLQQEVMRVLAQNLTELLGTGRVVTYPWEGAIPLDLQVTLEMRRFDPTADGDVQLEAVWSVLTGDGHKLLSMQRSSIAATAPGGSFDAIVQAQSQALGELSKAIARELVRLQGRSPNR